MGALESAYEMRNCVDIYIGSEDLSGYMYWNSIMGDICDLLDDSAALTDAVGTAHEQGVTHRDLKPANIMITQGGRVKVLDFGLAKISRKASAPDSKTPSTRSLLSEARIVGTPDYMSPEQARGPSIVVRPGVPASAARHPCEPSDCVSCIRTRNSSRSYRSTRTGNMKILRARVSGDQRT